MIHHATFGKKLKEKADRIGARVTLNTTEPEHQQADDLIDFLIEQLIESPQLR